jgi:hypothetical protein
MRELLGPGLQQKAQQYRVETIYRAAAHHRAATVYERNNKWLGVAAVVFSAIVGSSIFASLSVEGANKGAVVAAGLLSLAAAVLSALQTFLGYAKIAQEHKMAAAGYEAVRRKLDILLIEIAEDRRGGPLLPKLSPIVDELNAVTKASPTIPDAIFERAKRSIEADAQAAEKDGILEVVERAGGIRQQQQPQQQQQQQ